MSNQGSFKSRLGKFKILDSRIRDGDYTLFDIMKDVVIVKAEYKFSDNYIYYTALSPKFEELEPGSKPVWYHPTCLDGEVTWVKE